MSISPTIPGPAGRPEQSVEDAVLRFFSPAGRADQYTVFDELRAAGPLHPVPLGLHVLTRYADCATVLQSAAWSHANEAAALHPTVEAEEAASELPTSFLWMDPPDHTRLRALVSKAFTPRTVAALRPRISELCARLVDRVLGAGEFDLIEAIAYPLPLTVVCELVGVPAEAFPAVREWSFALSRGFDPDVLMTEEERLARGQAARDFQAYFRGLIDERRARPADDLLSALAAVEDQGDTLTQGELLATCVTLIVAGYETTVNLVGNGLLALMRHPDQFELLRSRRELTAPAVAELLRYDSPIAMTTRTALRPATIGGRDFAPGETVLPLIASANRDEAAFLDPGRLDLTRYHDRSRPAPRNLSFSLGIHYCLGASLVQVETEILLTELLNRVRVLEPATDSPRYKPNIVIRGLAELPARFLS